MGWFVGLRRSVPCCEQVEASIKYVLLPVEGLSMGHAKGNPLAARQVLTFIAPNFCTRSSWTRPSTRSFREVVEVPLS